MPSDIFSETVSRGSLPPAPGFLSSPWGSLLGALVCCTSSTFHRGGLPQRLLSEKFRLAGSWGKRYPASCWVSSHHRAGCRGLSESAQRHCRAKRRIHG